MIENLKKDISEIGTTVKDLQNEFSMPMLQLTNAIEKMGERVQGSVGNLTEKIDTLQRVHMKILCWLLAIVGTAFTGIKVVEIYKGLNP